jgi:acyl carrier protein
LWPITGWIPAALPYLPQGCTRYHLENQEVEENPMATTFERVRDIIVEQLGVDPADVLMEASFRDDLEADSLDLVELIMAFEEEFGGEISDEEAQRILTVGDAVTFLDGESS